MALRAKRHPEFLAERAEGHAEGRLEGRAEGRVEATAAALISVLLARTLPLDDHERRRILAERDPARLERWLVAAVRCASVAELLAMS